MNIKFDSEPVYGDNDKCIKTKIKLYGDNGNTIFQGKKIPKEIEKDKIENLIKDELVRSSSDESDNESDNELDNDESND